MPISELEGLEWQIRLFDGMPDDQQISQLRATIAEMDRVRSELAPMLAAWSSGDVEQLRRTVDAQDDSDPRLHRLLFTDRNAAWARWVRDRMTRPGTVFLAVGAGHLAGADSVINALQAQGLRVNRVPHVPDPR